MSLAIANFDDNSDESDLATAVRLFNEHHSHAIDKLRTPITKEEVVAAIRAKVWLQSGNKRNLPDEHSLAILESIAAGAMFPEGSQFSCITKLGSGDFEIGVWYIDLRVNSKTSRQYQIRIRSQYVDSRRYDDEELAKMRGGPKFRDP